MWDRLLRKFRGDGDAPQGVSGDDVREWVDRPRCSEEFAERLRAVGYGDKADALTALVRGSLRLTAVDSATDAESGSLRLGGRPLLANGTPWPRRADGAPLSLVAQVELDELSVVDLDLPLPGTGSLAFFYDAVEQSVWGFRPSDSDGWAVLYCPEGSGTLRDFPEDLSEEGRFPAVALTPGLEVTFPPAESFDVESITGETWPKRYWAVLGGSDVDATIHRLLGHPDPVQGDMQVECQLASNGVYVGDAKGHASPEGLRLRSGARDWRLLLQVDSDDHAGMMWGDVGRLYWWIRDSDLAEARWERCWLVLQCG